MLPLTDTIAWFVFLGLVLWAFQRLTHWLTRLNIFTIFLGFLVLRHGMTVPFDHTVNQWYAGISVSQAAYTRYYISLVLMWTGVLFGAWLARAFLGRATLTPKDFRESMAVSRFPDGINGAFLAVLVVCLGLLMVFQLRLSTEFWKLITGSLSAAEYRAMRDNFGEATHYSAGVGYRLASIARFGLLPTLICTLYFLAKGRPPWRYIFIFTVVLTLLIGLSSGQKGATVFVLLSLGIAYYYRRGRIRLRLANWRIWGAVVLGVCLVSFLYMLQYPGLTFDLALRATTYRMTSESDRSLQLYFQIYPDVQPFLHGQSSSLVNAALGSHLSVDQLPERFIPIYYLGPEYKNTWNAVFIGVAWADFGYWGVALESMFVGALLFSYARWFSRAPKTALVMGTQVGLLMATTRLSEAALSACLLTFGLLSSFLVFLLMRRYRRKRATTPTPEASAITYANPASRP